jgi:hypothetical protein
MAVVQVLSTEWSSTGKIPHIRDVLHAFLQEQVEKIISVDGVTLMTARTEISKLITTLVAEKEIEAMVIKDLTITVDGEGWENVEGPTTVFKRDGVLAITSASRGYSYGGLWGNTPKRYFGQASSAASAITGNEDDEELSSFPSFRGVRTSSWDRLSNAEMFDSLYP